MTIAIWLDYRRYANNAAYSNILATLSDSAQRPYNYNMRLAVHTTAALTWLGGDSQHGTASKCGGCQCLCQALLGLSNEPVPGVLRQQINFVKHHTEVPRGNLAHHETLCCLSLQARAQDVTVR